MKKQLEIGDKIQRFEVQRTVEIDYVYEITSITKTLAKSKHTVFYRDLNYNTLRPSKSTNKTIASVRAKLNSPFCYYYLIELT